MVGASLGEITACLVRVPVEIVKQRRQVSQAQGVFSHSCSKFSITLHHLEAGAVSSVDIVRSTWRAEGIGGFYRGYLTTVAR